MTPIITGMTTMITGAVMGIHTMILAVAIVTGIAILMAGTGTAMHRQISIRRS